MKVTDTSLIIASRLTGIPNIFPIVADDVEGDIVVYKRINSSPVTYKGGIGYFNADIEIVAVSSSYKGSILLANKVIDKVVGEG